jgi:hypothetical protein
LPDVPDKILKDLNITFVEHMDDVLKNALVGGEEFMSRHAKPVGRTEDLDEADKDEAAQISADSITSHAPN